MSLHWAAALLAVYALIMAKVPTAAAGLWSKEVQVPTFAAAPPRLSYKGRGEAIEGS